MPKRRLPEMNTECRAEFNKSLGYWLFPTVLVFWHQHWNINLCDLARKWLEANMSYGQYHKNVETLGNGCLSFWLVHYKLFSVLFVGHFFGCSCRTFLLNFFLSTEYKCVCVCVDGCVICMHVTCLTSHFLPHKPEAGFWLNLALGRFNGNSFETFFRKSVHRLPVHPSKSLNIYMRIFVALCVCFCAWPSTASILFFSARFWMRIQQMFAQAAAECAST